jgi:predicted transcriptional regulator
MEDFNVRDGRDDRPVFIHSELDDYGLSCVEFRVYARLARRSGNGVARESVPRMAKEFEVSDRTVQRALRVLVRCRLASETPRDGRPTEYTLNPRSAWLPKNQLKAIRADVANKARPEEGGDTTAGGDTEVKSRGVTPAPGAGVTPQTDEGSTGEGNTVVDISARARLLPDWLPPKLWARWIAHLTQKGKPITVEQAKGQIEKLNEFRARGMPPEAVVNEAITRGWQSFFELKQERNANGQANQQPRQNYAGKPPVTRDFSKYPARTG